jgi:hypothetical protein
MDHPTDQKLASTDEDLSVTEDYIPEPKESARSGDILSGDVSVDNNRQSESSALETDRTSLATDRFGFIISDSDSSHMSLSISDRELISRKNKESERALKWVEMKKRWNKFDHTSKLKSRVRKGIPDPLRSFAWIQLSSIEKIRKQHPVPHDSIDLNSVTDGTKDEVRTRLEY